MAWLRRTPYYALSMGMTQQFFFFCPWWPWPLTLDLTFKLRRDFRTLYLTAKFDSPTLVVRKLSCGQTNPLTNKVFASDSTSHRFNKSEVDTAEFQYRHQDQCWLAESGGRVHRVLLALMSRFLLAMHTRSLCKFIVSHSEQFIIGEK